MVVVDSIVWVLVSWIAVVELMVWPVSCLMFDCDSIVCACVFWMMVSDSMV